MSMTTSGCESADKLAKTCWLVQRWFDLCGQGDRKTLGVIRERVEFLCSSEHYGNAVHADRQPDSVSRPQEIADLRS